MATKQYKVEIRDGRQLLSAGDADRQLVLSGFTENITQVQFDDIHGSETLDVNVVKDGDNYICDIPNQLLTGKYSELIGYVVAADDKGSYTVCKARFEITVRQTSGGYICDPMRLETWAEILAQATAAKDAAATSAEEASAAETHCEEISEWVDNVQATVGADAKQVATDKAAVETLKTDIESTVSQGKTDIETARTDAVSAVKAQQAASVSAVESAGTTAQSNIASDKSAALKAVQDQQSASVTAVQSQQTTSANAVKAQETSSKAVLSDYETRCKSYSDSAASSKSAAATSESNAATSEANAKASETNAASSETKVKGYVDSLKTFETEAAELKPSDKILVVDSNNNGKYKLYQSLLSDIQSDLYLTPTMQALVDAIDGGTFEASYPEGTAIVSTFTYGGKTYEYPWLVVDASRDEVLADGSASAHRAVLQPQYLPPSAIAMQFSQYQAFYRCSSGLAAGTYSVTFAQAWSKLTSDMLTWSFTLTKAVPVGGRLAGFRNFADGQSDTKVRAYSNDGKTIIETATATVGEADGATNLGTLPYQSPSGDFSSMQQTFYGLNEYEYSAIMQWLDSDSGQPDWWLPQSDWDCAPDQASTLNGFLSYLDRDFVKALKYVQVKTYHNNVQGKSGTYTTGIHRCFLPSLEEMYCVTQGAGEGDYLPYWKTRKGLDSPQGWYSSNALAAAKCFPVDAKTEPYTFWLRSAYRGNAGNPWYVNSSGNVYSYYHARYSFRALPLVVL